MSSSLSVKMPESRRMSLAMRSSLVVLGRRPLHLGQAGVGDEHVEAAKAFTLV